MDGLVIPSTLKYSLYRMIQDASISTNVLRLIPLNVQTVDGGGMISVRLPLATCSLPSFSMSFNNYISSVPTFSNSGNTQQAYQSDTSTCGVAFPEGLEGLIQRLEIVVAGVSLMTLPNYNMLYQVLKDINQTLDHKISRHIVEGEHSVEGNVNVNISGGGNEQFSNEIFTVGHWTVFGDPNGSRYLTVNCTSMYPIASQKGGSLVINAPPASFFGWKSTNPVISHPSIVGFSTPFLCDGYVAGLGYQFGLVYDLGATVGHVWSSTTSGTATGGAVAINQAYNIPFSCYCVDSQSITDADTIHINDIRTSQTQSNTIRDFLGFFKAMPKAIQLAALGEVEIRIYLEQPQNVLVVPASGQTFAQFAGASPAAQTSAGQYTLTNIEFQIRTMSWDNGWLDSMMQSELSKGNTLEIPYPNYYSVIQRQSAGSSKEIVEAGGSTTRFSVNTQNLRQVWAVNRPLFQVNPQQLFVPSGIGMCVDGSLGRTYKGQFFCTTASNPSVWSTRTRQDFGDFGFTSPVSNRYQFLINNQLIPNLLVNPQRNYAFTQELLGKEQWQEGTAIGTPMTYMSCAYAMGITLEYLNKYGDASIRDLFGLDTRSASSVFYLNQTNNNAGDTTLVFSLFTSVLRVAMNNQIQVII